MVLLTDGENPIEIEDWELMVKKINDLDIHMTIVYVLFPMSLMISKQSAVALTLTTRNLASRKKTRLT